MFLSFLKQGMQFGMEGIFQVIMENNAGIKSIPRTHSKELIVFSSIASFAFHPLLMTALMAFAVYKLAPDDFSNFPFSEFKKWFSQLLLYTVLLPLIFIFIFLFDDCCACCKIQVLDCIKTVELKLVEFSL